MKFCSEVQFTYVNPHCFTNNARNVITLTMICNMWELVVLQLCICQLNHCASRYWQFMHGHFILLLRHIVWYVNAREKISLQKIFWESWGCHYDLCIQHTTKMVLTWHMNHIGLHGHFQYENSMYHGFWWVPHFLCNFVTVKAL